MIKRIVEISNPAYLHVRHGQLVIERDKVKIGQVPIEDIGVLIIDNQQVVTSQAVMIECSAANAIVLICDQRHMPTTIVQPLAGHTLHSKILRAQVQASEPTKKRLWQHIVKAKIRHQALVLAMCDKSPGPLLGFEKRVKSGDPDNLEAQAARAYWPRLMGSEFRRDVDLPGTNAMLNYGYALIRASIARTVVGAGLHPAFGLHHKNQYNAFVLVDDLIEPFRPIVDLCVWQYLQQQPANEQLSQAEKRQLFTIFYTELRLNGKKWPLPIAISHFAAAVREAICENLKNLEIPAL